MFPSVKATVLFSGSLQTLLRVCSVAGQVVAVRLAFHRKAQEAAQLEAAVYQRLQSLQGRHVPRLVAHGYTCAGSAYFVATEYVKVIFSKVNQPCFQVHIILLTRCC